MLSVKFLIPSHRNEEMDFSPGVPGMAFSRAVSASTKGAGTGNLARFLVLPGPRDVMIPPVPEAKILLPPN
ncbi:hypothetical protein [Herbaspirillum sp. C9C3]|uniref:hypothetical protein n=1 Tax=Herbaspirillum sp. C9C3 TaxID=2735271 RepID=UPI00158556BE|nr:hypothetical protein [Herbaspirillum sp. C9C3]NUT59769.1 hypothetical protein [Herbaspirillum sp. C9C3]